MEGRRLVANCTTLQWGRRVNTAECLVAVTPLITTPLASMGPPREHGGMVRGPLRWEVLSYASMGPPREHGGMTKRLVGSQVDIPASMGPPREHGGMLSPGASNSAALPLQWGRRVNTAE